MPLLPPQGTERRRKKFLGFDSAILFLSATLKTKAKKRRNQSGFHPTRFAHISSRFFSGALDDNTEGT